MNDLIYPEPHLGPCICYFSEKSRMAERDCPQHGYEKQSFRTNILHRHLSSDGVYYSHRHKRGAGRHVHVNKGKLDRMMAE